MIVLGIDNEVELTEDDVNYCDTLEGLSVLSGQVLNLKLKVQGRIDHISDCIKNDLPYSGSYRKTVGYMRVIEAYQSMINERKSILRIRDRNSRSKRLVEVLRGMVDRSVFNDALAVLDLEDASKIRL